MRTIELIGPSGAGKTTFKNSLKKNRVSTRKWVTRDEGLCDVYKKNLLRYATNLDFAKNFIRKGKSAALEQMISSMEIAEDSPFEQVFSHTLKQICLEERYSAFQKINLLNWYFKIIKTSEFFKKNNYEKLILMDEGLINNTPNFENFEISEAILPVGCIFFHLNVATNMDWLKQRKENGILRGIHQNLNETDLKNYVQNDHERFQIKRKFLATLDIPILDIHCENNPVENIFMAGNFLDKLS